MNENYCGANCSECPSKAGCKGCMESCGSPLGGKCIAKEYIKAGGMEAYNEFKKLLLNEINEMLRNLGMPEASGLCELPGVFVNLEYTLPNGTKAKFLNDKDICLGTQIELADTGLCCGVASDSDFILICRYRKNGSDPELVAFKKR